VPFEVVGSIVEEWEPGVVAMNQCFQYDLNMEEKEVVRSLGALAHGLRLQVFRALVVAGPRGMTPGVMAEGSGIPPATLSFHLKDLMNAGLVTQERDGRHLIYRASIGHMNALLGYLTANCCQGEACIDDAAAACNC
jgi:DNA-binding transcriptional ArsR family regulator